MVALQEGYWHHIYLKRDLYRNGLYQAEAGRAYAMDAKEYCAFTGLGAQDEGSWYMRKLRQEEFLRAGFIFVRHVENQDMVMKVKRHEDGDESHIYAPQNRNIEHGTTQWFFTDMHGTRRCLATGMLREKVSMDEGEVGALKARPSITSASGDLEVSNVSPMHLRSTNGVERRGPKVMSVSEAPDQVRAVQAVHKAVVPSLDLPVTGETAYPRGWEHMSRCPWRRC